MTRFGRAGSGMLAALLLASAFTGPAAAQEDRIPSGVRLGFIFQTGYRPKLAVRPVQGSGVAPELADRVYDILQRDLDYSDRFVMATTPAALVSGAVDYRAWNDLGVVYLLTGELQPVTGGLGLRLALHDVVYGNVKELRAFRLPGADDPGFRMAVHAAADEVVRWATGQPGAAASRVVFRRKGSGGNEVMVVDSDGENLRRLAGGEGMLMSPAWAPDASRIMYVESDGAVYRVLEQPIGGGSPRVISESRALTLTPAYGGGGRVAYARYEGSGSRIYEYDAAEECCLKRLTGGPRDDLSPSYSADGTRVAFNSNRLGQPHIYVMPADGGEPQLLSPFVYGEPGYYTSPDWSPTGTLVAFHGRSRGAFQIMVADAARPGATVQQITADGESEDPSWAPDGRHVVFSGVREGRTGLYVIDTVTGRLRPLLVGGRYELPDWSPSMARVSPLASEP